MSREMKYSGTDWIGEIPVQWELAPTKRVFRGKKRIVGDEADNYERLALTLNGVVKRTKDDNEGLQPEQFNNYQILEKNELVFKLIDLQNIRTSRVGLSPYTGIVSPAYIILSNSETDNRFYYYWFMDMYNRCIFNQMGDDGVRSALNIKDVLEIPLPLISESTRIKIASFLDKKCSEIDEMIAMQEKIVEELKAYKQSVITEAVTKGLNPDVPMKDSGIEWIGEIPEHWKVDLLSLLFEEHKQKNTGLLCKNLLSLSYGKIVRKNIDSVGGLLPQSYDGYNIVDKGDIVFRLTDLQNDKKSLRTGLVRERGIVTSAYVTLRSRKPVLSAYYQYLFHSYDVMKVFYGMGDGVRQGMNYGDLRKMLIVTPPHSEQNEIVEFLDTKCTEIDNLISIKLSKIDSLKEYKKSIIYEYVTGKKEVTE